MKTVIFPYAFILYIYANVLVQMYVDVICLDFMSFVQDTW